MITRSQSKNLESPPSSGDSAEDLSQQTAKIEDSLSDALGLSKNKKTTLNKLSSDARASGSPSPNVKSNQSLGSHDNRNVAFGPKNVHDRTSSRATRDAYDNSKPDPKSRLRKLVDEDAVKVNAVSDKDFNDLIESFRGQKAQIQFLTNWMKRLADRFKLFDKSSNNDNSRSSLRSNSNDKSDQSSPGTQNKVRFSSPARNPLKTNIRSESPSRERRKCYLCGEEGHVAAHCRLDKSKSKVMTVSFENFTSDDSDSSVSPKDLGLDL